VPTAEFDPDQLERLMVAAFELLGKPQDDGGDNLSLALPATRTRRPLTFQFVQDCRVELSRRKQLSFAKNDSPRNPRREKRAAATYDLGHFGECCSVAASVRADMPGTVSEWRLLHEAGYATHRI
jgi:hypothetical protein